MSTLTPFADMSPVPRVLVDVPVGEFPAGSVTVTIRSTCDGRTMDVRGARGLPASAPAIVLDPEPGLSVPTSYTVVGFDANGNEIGSWPLGSVTVNFSGVVIQQPLDPQLSVAVVRMARMASEIERESPADLLYPQGQVLPSMVGLGPRGGITDLAIDVRVASHEDADTLQATLGTYSQRQLPVWLIRTPPGQRLPRRLFCRVSGLRELDDSWWTEEVRFRAVVTEVRPPAVNVSAAVLTHSDMKVFYTTHTQVKAKYATHSDVKRDTSLIGAADA